jgi:hypothetical protein
VLFTARINENKMKQTAVEWLKFQINSIQFQDPAAEELYLEIQPLIEQAKAMEKEQIIRAHLMARCYDNPNSHNEAEQYYTETYESKTNI